MFEVKALRIPGFCSGFQRSSEFDHGGHIDVPDVNSCAFMTAWVRLETLN